MILDGRDSYVAAKERAEGPKACKAHLETGLRDRTTGAKMGLGLLKSQAGQIPMRSLSENLAKDAQEVVA